MKFIDTHILSMIFEGDESVIDAIKEKKRLMDEGEPHDHIRPLLIIDGGLMKGAYGVGAGIAIHENGYSDVFTDYGGISSGGATIAYLLSGSIELGQKIIYEDCCSKEFLNLHRLWNILNPKHFEEALRGTTGKPLHPEKILEKKSHFYVGLSEYETANPVLFNPDTVEDLFLSLRATISMPASTLTKTFIDGVRYVDGASTKPHCVEEMIRTIDATHVLAITNQDKETKRIAWTERLLCNTLLRHRMSTPLRKVAMRRRQIRHKFINEILQSPPKPVLFVWGDGSIKSQERDPKTVKATVDKSRAWWNDMLSGA